MPDVKTRFTISNEKEYKDAISRIGDSMRVLNSEMKKVESAYARDADSMEALTAKNEVLTKQIEKQKEKIEITKQALEKATAAQAAANEKLQQAQGVLDENSDEYKRLAQAVEDAKKKTERWQTNLNNAEAAMNSFKNKLEENKEAIEKSSKTSEEYESTIERIRKAFERAKDEGTGVKGVFSNIKNSFADTKKESVGLGDAIGKVADKLGINLPDGADKALEALNGIDAGTAQTVGTVAAFAAAITKVEKKLIDLTNNASDYAREVQQFSSMTGQTTEQVQEWQYVSGLLGVSYDRIRDSLKEVTNKMQEADQGSGEAAEAFKKLGVNIRGSDWQLRSANDVFLDTIEALGNMQNQSERDALAMDLMSESAQELNPIIEAGREKISDYAQEAHDMGVVLEEDELKALTDVKTAFVKLQEQQEATKNQLATEFAPYLESFYNDATEGIATLGDTLEESGIVTAFGALLQFVGDLINPAEELSSDTLPGLEYALRGVAGALAIIVDSLRAIGSFFGNGLAKGIDTGDWTEFNDAWSFKNTNKLYQTWAEADGRKNRARGSGFSNGASTQSVVNNYYTVSGVNVKTVNQVADAAENSRQHNRKYGG